MFSKRKKSEREFVFDKKIYKPVIHASICTGEEVAGFKNINTGKFTELMLIKNSEDLKKFCGDYGVESQEIVKEY